MKKVLFIFAGTFLLFSCVTTPIRTTVSENIMDKGVKTPQQLHNFFIQHTGGIKSEKALLLAEYYVGECALEGVNSDIAFVQMCLETGFLKFGNLVTEDMNNFCGLGAINAQNPGLRFESEQIGVRAHVQHLKAYGSSQELRMPLVDPRYRYVTPKGKAPTIWGLAGTWAADKSYGEKLSVLLAKLTAY